MKRAGRSRLIAIVIVMLVAITAGPAPSQSQPQPQPTAGGSRFQSLEIYVDSAEPLAAWQFELSASAANMRVVGVENGASPAFADAPYFDLEAIQRGTAERIVVADFSIDENAPLPVGRTRIATVHVQLSGDTEPDFQLRLVAAGGTQGQSIEASIELDAGQGR